jgi:hypothetical protein
MGPGTRSPVGGHCSCNPLYTTYCAPDLSYTRFVHREKVSPNTGGRPSKKKEIHCEHELGTGGAGDSGRSSPSATIHVHMTYACTYLRVPLIYANTPSVLWAPQNLLSVDVHNLKTQAACWCCGLSLLELDGSGSDTQFIFTWGCLAVVHTHSINPDKFSPRGLPCVYIGTGYFNNFHGAKFLNPAKRIFYIVRI